MSSFDRHGIRATTQSQLYTLKQGAYLSRRRLDSLLELLSFGPLQLFTIRHSLDPGQRLPLTPGFTLGFCAVFSLVGYLVNEAYGE